ncbi:MAG TPA: hypothetical protein VK209_04555 [Candidatus Sulfotelmatobacter sp.]|nr:hypothetical protein [Candidatus Sulfotelmatobacter sp.]
MSHKPQSKDEALEALDFVVNVLKEHEKDLDKLIGELATITGQIGSTSELTGKVEKIEQNVTDLQSEISNLINCLSIRSTQPSNSMISLISRETMTPIDTDVNTPKTLTEVQRIVAPIMKSSFIPNMPVILRCKQWDDFQSLAFKSQTMSFMVKEAEHTFQVDALKDNQIMTYTGDLPKIPVLLKIWLMKQLSVDEKKILEGVLALG